MVVMPTLPALDVSQAHYDRIVAAFPGATLAEKATNYQNWLVNSLIDEVERLERQKIEATFAAQMTTQLQALAASLPPRTAYPPRPPATGGTLPRNA